MGYTHYWTRKKLVIDNSTWAAIERDVRELFKLLPAEAPTLTLVREYDEPGTEPLVNGALICFNGEGELGHETFYFPRTDTSDFGFCKTARKPYDLAVQAVLRIIAHHEPSVVLSSDGEEGAFVEGERLAARIRVARNRAARATTGAP